ncbi:DUF2314 domain-containing protein [Iodobacter fluviatilis]|uniref:Uncharacterized protein YegJ (DUF2314 family) n=1 Tax=Iodobacter fluviatilis TaxID=537 RepID=A0A377Q6A1_9NEIS|nr:DUF2314 domain-containing protein [Iodobacter fluviatilis]TCU86943.1 uncharacterized protein YegJ (DUF2314 family) [Iodobacter fluviatilis]STQ90275.1 Uncharacterized protein conserved in bacteria (DUF2314) [Iodobacter fluviatilis]
MFGMFRRKNLPAEPISWFEGEDTEMLSAISRAQESYPEFIAALEEESRRVVPAFEQALVKYSFPASKRNVKVEHIFLSDIEKRGDSVFGIVNGEPIYTNVVREGDRIEIERPRISDWLYVVNGVGVGGFTFKVMWAKFSDKEKAGYRDQAPFRWLADLV